MSYNIEIFDKIDKIPFDVDSFLNQEPEVNFEAIEILERLREDTNSYNGILECMVVSNQENILVVTCRIQPYNLLISHSNDLGSISTLVERYLELKIEIPGIYGPLEEVKTFVKAWQELTDEKFQTEEEFLQYSLRSLETRPEYIGDISIATKEHEQLLIAWITASIREIVPNTTENFEKTCISSLQKLIKKRRVFILDVDGTIVSMAAVSGRTKQMQAINDVYTPPEYRGLGHATELCTFLSDYILNDCKNLPILWVKVTNEATIRISEKIGFKQVAKMSLCLKKTLKNI